MSSSHTLICSTYGRGFHEFSGQGAEACFVLDVKLQPVHGCRGLRASSNTRVLKANHDSSRLIKHCGDFSANKTAPSNSVATDFLRRRTGDRRATVPVLTAVPTFPAPSLMPSPLSKFISRTLPYNCYAFLSPAKGDGFLL